MEDIRHKLIEYLEANDLKYTEKEEKIIHSCLNPLHSENHPSSFTSLKDDLPFTYCSSCKFSLNTEALYKFLELGIDEDMVFQAVIDKMLKEGDIKPEHSSQLYLPLKDGDFDKPYRKISGETFKKVGAYYTFSDGFYGRRIIFTIKDINEKPILFEAVSTNKNITPKVLRPKNVNTDKLFGFENLIQSDTVFICEGLFSALSFIELGYDGVFNFGIATIKNKVRQLLSKGVRNVVLVGDVDKVGREFNKSCYHILKHNFNVAFFQYPYKYKEKGDANDLLKDGLLQECIDKTLEKNMIKVTVRN